MLLCPLILDSLLEQHLLREHQWILVLIKQNFGDTSDELILLLLLVDHLLKLGLLVFSCLLCIHHLWWLLRWIDNRLTTINFLGDSLEHRWVKFQKSLDFFVLLHLLINMAMLRIYSIFCIALAIIQYDHHITFKFLLIIWNINVFLLIKLLLSCMLPELTHTMI